MATITALRQEYLNKYLQRSDGSSRPWTDDTLNQYLEDSLIDLWPTNGIRVTGDVATQPSSQEYTLPASIARVQRIDVLDASNFYVDRITNWREIPSGKVVITPILNAGYVLRFVGWKAMAADGADLPTSLEASVCRLAASLAYGGLASDLLNSERQQNLDTGRVIDYQSAIGLSAYYSRIGRERLAGDHTTAVMVGPRSSRR